MRRGCGEVVTELSALKLIEEGRIFEMGPHVPVTHTALPTLSCLICTLSTGGLLKNGSTKVLLVYVWNRASRQGRWKERTTVVPYSMLAVT